jgi:L-fuculose-phosphate aldolase
MALYQNDLASRQLVVDGIRELVDSGLTSGTSGNVSVLTEEGMLITPTGVAPGQLQAEHIVSMALDGSVPDDQLTPSSEWRMHADIYANKPGLEAVVHCHSNYATILATAHKSIPAQHYMIAASGSYEIPLAPYATFGSQELSTGALQALSGSLACLLANHGQLATGFDLPGALKLAALVEELAHWYWGALAIGGPELLSKEQMDDVMTAFASYGQQAKHRELAIGNSLAQKDQ